MVKINETEYRVFEAFAALEKANKHIRPSQQEIANKSGIDVGTVNRTLKTLVLKGFMANTEGVARSYYIVKALPTRRVKAKRTEVA